MSRTLILPESGVGPLLEAVLAKTRLVAPCEGEGRFRFARIASAGDVRLPEISAANSVKEFFFPKSELLATYKGRGRSVEVVASDARAAKPFVIFGARPCDAAALEIMDKVFSSDAVDETWKARRDAATVITVGCAKADKYCFCTSVGLAPDSPGGADVILLPVEGASFAVEAVTAKGEAFVAAYAAFFKPDAGAKREPATVARSFDPSSATRWLAGNFDSPLWAAESLRCLGCGICTYYCPTCHCFDIQDEADGDAGLRLKNWDSCSFALFTKHASGHNPRGDRAARWRQRIMHKFSYYPKLFGVISCTGCGRCARLCPVDLGVEETLRAIGEGHE